MLEVDCKTIESVILEVKASIIDGFPRKIRTLPSNLLLHPIESIFDTEVPVCREYSSDYLQLKQEDFLNTFRGKAESNWIPSRFREVHNKKICNIFDQKSPEYLCPEAIIPREMDRLFNPKLFKLLLNETDINDHQNDYLVKVMAGKRGSYAHLHFDWDLKTNLFLQVYGKKKIILFPPTQSRLLKGFINQSSLFLENLSVARRKNVVESLGGIEAEVEVGQAIIIPPLYWHFVDYTDDAISFSLRCFSKNLKNFRIENYYRTWKFPILISTLKHRPEELSNVLSRMQAILNSSLLSSRKYTEIEKIYHETLISTDYLRGGLTMLSYANEEYYLGRKSLFEINKNVEKTLIAVRRQNSRFTMNLRG